jgi:glucose 1-dehydrogenase/3-oxoacyl-[acyl-carrier protein] reductase
VNDEREQVALVTGAGQGIGRAITERFIRDGMWVVAFDRNGDALAGVARELGPKVVTVVGDVVSEEDVIGAVDRAVNELGGLDVVAAHAGIAEPRAFLDLDFEHWHRHMSVNVDGVFAFLLHGARAMVRLGRPGSMIVTASINGFFVEETMTPYNVSKGALLTLVRSAAIDLGSYGIRVNGIAPGVVDTPIAALVVHNPDVAPSYLKTIPLGRFGEPRDIADVVAWLASNQARYVTGHTVVIDGGQTLGIMGNMEGAG